MKVTILGSGTCVPRLSRSASAILVEVESSKILLDLGPGTLRRLLEYGVNLSEIGYIFLSHFHPDHSAELISFLFAAKYPSRRRRNGVLHVLGGVGLQRLYAALQTAFGKWIELPAGQLILTELDTILGETKTFQDFTIQARPVNHQPESLAYRVEDRQAKAMVYSGDTDVSDNLVALAKGADLFICESAVPDELKETGHLTPALAGEAARRAGAKRLVLTHLYPECDEVDLRAQAAVAYDGPIVIAEDLLSFVLK
jgi:ribonuclease BN (tRNA processing enzyme)